MNKTTDKTLLIGLIIVLVLIAGVIVWMGSVYTRPLGKASVSPLVPAPLLPPPPILPPAIEEPVPAPVVEAAEVLPPPVEAPLSAPIVALQGYRYECGVTCGCLGAGDTFPVSHAAVSGVGSCYSTTSPSLLSASKYKEVCNKTCVDKGYNSGKAINLFSCSRLGSC